MLRSLDKIATEQQSRVARPRQFELNSQLDLDKGDQQSTDSLREIKDDMNREKEPAPPLFMLSTTNASMAGC
jgi:hypothetical protein